MGLLLSACCCSVRGGVCSPVAGVETLKIGFDLVPLPLNACSGLKEMIAEGSEALAVTEDIFTNCVVICSSAQWQPKVMFLSLLCSSQI